jgi:4-hydroxy-4-methyl-2-oxoglutarate aldolase
MVAHSNKVLETLARYDSPTIANIIELFDVRPRNEGYMNGSITARYPNLPPVLGYATTVKFRSAYPSNRSDVYLRLAEHVRRIEEDLPAPRIVVFQDLDSPSVGATVGEIMVTAYKRFGCAGLITSGAVRDILQIEEMRFPIFSNSIIVSHGYSHIEEIHIPVHVGGLQVKPGDLLHADANGIVLIPHEIAEKAANACQDFVAAEKICLDYLERKDATPTGLAHALRQGKEIVQRLSSTCPFRADPLG